MCVVCLSSRVVVSCRVASNVDRLTEKLEDIEHDGPAKDAAATEVAVAKEITNGPPSEAREISDILEKSEG